MPSLPNPTTRVLPTRLVRADVAVAVIRMSLSILLRRCRCFLFIFLFSIKGTSLSLVISFPIQRQVTVADVFFLFFLSDPTDAAHCFRFSRTDVSSNELKNVPVGFEPSSVDCCTMPISNSPNTTCFLTNGNYLCDLFKPHGRK